MAASMIVPNFASERKRDNLEFQAYAFARVSLWCYFRLKDLGQPPLDHIPGDIGQAKIAALAAMG